MSSYLFWASGSRMEEPSPVSIASSAAILPSAHRVEIERVGTRQRRSRKNTASCPKPSIKTHWSCFTFFLCRRKASMWVIAARQWICPPSRFGLWLQPPFPSSWVHWVNFTHSLTHSLLNLPHTRQTVHSLLYQILWKQNGRIFRTFFFLGWFVILYMHHNHDKSSIREGWAALGVEDPLLNEICSKISSQKSWWGSFDTPANKHYRDTDILYSWLIILFSWITCF